MTDSAGFSSIYKDQGKAPTLIHRGDLVCTGKFMVVFSFSYVLALLPRRKKIVGAVPGKDLLRFFMPEVCQHNILSRKNDI